MAAPEVDAPDVDCSVVPSGVLSPAAVVVDPTAAPFSTSGTPRRPSMRSTATVAARTIAATTHTPDEPIGASSLLTPSISQPTTYQSGSARVANTGAVCPYRPQPIH